MLRISPEEVPLRSIIRCTCAPILAAFLALLAPVSGQTTHVIDVSGGPFGHFQPNDMYIQLGDTVRWEWTSGTHDIVAVSGAFSSGSPAPPPSYFDCVFDMGVLNSFPVLCNEYRYECTVHGEQAAVTVLVPDLSLRVYNLTAGSTASFMVDGATASGTVRLAYSPSGAGPTTVNLASCGMLDVGLSMPIVPFARIQADAMGMAAVSGKIPAGTTGLSVWIQAIDLMSCRASNTVAGIIG